jgi:hypothetical protein
VGSHAEPLDKLVTGSIEEQAVLSFRSRAGIQSPQ